MSRGAGPGAITPDGCSVDLYTLLPPGPGPGIIHAAIAPGAAVLELGCGAGRVSGPLAALGHEVVAVDESPEMLAHVRGAQTVRARIEDLRLDRRFGAVVLASHLINSGERTRRAFLRTCRGHVAATGCVVIEQHPPAWFETAGPSRVDIDGITCTLRDVSRPGPGALAASVEYAAGGRVWTQTFTAFAVSAAALPGVLAEAGLALDAYLTADHAWLRAVPLPAGRS
jgi:SAM-dependent methyltransferase